MPCSIKWLHFFFVNYLFYLCMVGRAFSWLELFHKHAWLSQQCHKNQAKYEDDSYCSFGIQENCEDVTFTVNEMKKAENESLVNGCRVL